VSGSRVLIGVDPGLTGALAFFRPADQLLRVYDMPTREKPSGGREVDGAELSDIVYRFTSLYDNVLAVVEKVSAMTGQESAASSFSFGRSFGIVLGVLCAYRVNIAEIRPAVWKAMYNLDRNKDNSINLAKQYFPGVPAYFALKKHNGRAEAALLARLGHTALSGDS
jgi:crossover junction endodeoxyribonuclease RuvC